MEELYVFCLSLIWSVFAYLLVPTILCLCKKKFTLSRIKLITFLNGFCVWLIFMIIRINAGIDGTSFAVCLWSVVAYLLMKKYCLKTSNDSKPIEENKPIVECKPIEDSKTNKKYVITQVKIANSENTQAQKTNKSKTIKSGIKWFMFFLIFFLLVFSAICNINQYAKNKELNKQIETLENEVVSNEEENDISFSEWSDAKINSEKAKFLDENIVFVIGGCGDYFYTYDEMMNEIEGKGELSYWAYNKDLAIGKGYKAASAYHN